jgi:type IV pilus assembly protein PilC
VPTYTYKARDQEGKIVKGVLERNNKEMVIEELRALGCIPTQIKEGEAEIKTLSMFDAFKRISTEAMNMFYIQLSNMLNANISLVMALDTIGKQVANSRLNKILNHILEDVKAGESFSRALVKHPLFSNIFISMIRAGEISGKLDVILTRYAEFSESQMELKQKIKGALFYPIILLFAGLAVTLFMVTAIVPKFADIFVKAGVMLPVPTFILYNVGMGIKNYWYLGILFCLILILGGKHFLRTKSGKLLFDSLILKLPVIGILCRRIAISRFTRTLGTLVGSDVPILESLDITKGVISNDVLACVVDDVRCSVEKGERIFVQLKSSKEFPLDVVQMISVGEESGNLSQMLYKISDFYDKYVAFSIKKMTTVMEPVFLLVIGTMVGFIMSAMLLPIFDMMKTLRH